MCLPLYIRLFHTLPASLWPAFVNVFLTRSGPSLLRRIISITYLCHPSSFSFRLVELKVIKYQVVAYMFLLRPGSGHWCTYNCTFACL